MIKFLKSIFSNSKTSDVHRFYELPELFTNFHYKIINRGIPNFMIDIGYNNQVAIQVVHPVNVPESKIPNNKQEMGYVIYLPFDPSDSSNEKKIEKMNGLSVIDKFEKFNYQGIPCYSYYQKENTEELYKVIKELLIGVYGFQKEQRFYFDVWMQ